MARLKIIVTMAVAMMVPMSWMNPFASRAVMAPLRVSTRSCRLASGSEPTARSESAYFCTRTLMTCTTVATTSVIGRTERQWLRTVATAPSRISPRSSGRSGITPGLAAGGLPHWPGPPG